MYNPGPNPPANHCPGRQPGDHVHDSHSKVGKHDELRYGKTYAPAQGSVTATEKVRAFLRTDDPCFWTGVLIGSVATFVLTSDTVKQAIVKSFVRVGEEAKKEVKEAVVKKKEGIKTEKAEKK